MNGLPKEILLEFPHEYEVRVVAELPGSGGAMRRLFFPGGLETGGRDGVLVSVFPRRARPWLGCFAHGSPTHSALTRVMSCPNPREVCVISSGAGYIVRVDEPTDWSRVRANPVCEGLSVLDRGLLVLTDFTKVAAYGTSGLQWESQRISSDGVQLVGVANNKLNMRVWDAASGVAQCIWMSLDDGSVLSDTW